MGSRLVVVVEATSYKPSRAILIHLDQGHRMSTSENFFVGGETKKVISFCGILV
jgi:hypothetical protein